MPSRFRQNHKPFGEQSRRQRKAIYIATKNRIRRAAPILGGKFFTNDYMHGANNWLDGYFLGPKAPLVYNLTIETTASAYKEAVESLAWDSSYEVALDREPPMSEGAIRDPVTGGRRYLPRESIRYPEFDGMTRLQWVKSRCQQIADSGDVQVHEEWTLHRDYACGIGVHAAIDVPVLTIESVNAFIDRFLANPTDYRNPVPRSFRYEEINHWGLDTNLVMAPWDWAKAESDGAASRESPTSAPTSDGAGTRELVDDSRDALSKASMSTNR